ncbi:hypothetical protein CKM354_000991700 [Cercospora kikuchii]|uniref:MOZ protein represents a chromatin-associated acetyltransferase n=1 Tax=Cercospora kikuchii TaxID=84275 RepID=A0A9P3CSL0_9PEZI|nr:uncharacterized protein CKM354_000991700 [Cercospora kikuchii]GIZ46807.1 hypothetical protein CKM354_000991700 [Cercospora kikuchii]
MAAPRLPFLWPMLARGFESTSPSVRSARAAQRIQAFHSSPRRRRPEVTPPQQQRYGTANEPLPHLANGKKRNKKNAPAEQQKRLPKIGEKLQTAGEAEVKAERQELQTEDVKKEPKTEDVPATSRAHSDPLLDGATPIQKAPGAPETLPEKPLETLLEQVPGPVEHAEEQQASSSKAPPEEQSAQAFDEHAPSTKAPHISTPRHVHHFDTYGLVNRLKDGNWSEAQAITTMKGVRVMLAENMDLAREALVSKSQVENETYLFRAACAELKTEVTSRRRAEQEKMRTERAQLQHEVEILTQRLGQEIAAMKDDIKGTFDDRKMAVRNDERLMESKIQRLNYQITVDLQADAKSEVEGLRWVMTRRVILALGVIVIMVVGSLRIYSNAVHEQELTAKRLARMRSGGTQTDSGSGRGGPSSGDSPPGGQGMNGGEMLVDSLPTG